MSSSAWTPVDETASQWTPVPEPGAASRIATNAREAVGIPANPVKDLSQGLTYAAQNPGDAAKQLALSPVEAYKSAVQSQYDRMHAAYQRGDYAQALLHGLYYLTAPIGGANLGKASEQAVQGDIPSSLGTTLGTVAPFIAGSTEARSAASAVTAPVRSAVATGIEKSAPAVSTAATVAGAGHELLNGRPWSAAIIANEGKPGITRTMNGLADFIRPENGFKPLPRSYATLHDAINFMNSPGIEGETPAAPARASLESQRDVVGGQQLLPTPMVGTQPATQVYRSGLPRLLPSGPQEAQPTLNSAPAASVSALERPVVAAGSGDTIPRTQNGETVIQQALMGLDKPTLLKIAKARGISTTQEAALIDSKANPSLVNKIGDSLTQDEIDDARDMGIEMSRNKPVQNPNIPEDAGKEAWRYKVVKTFFPDVELPKTMQARAQATIGNRPDFSAQYEQAAKQSLPANASPAQLKAKAMEIQAQDEDLSAILQDSINKVQQGKLAVSGASGPQGGHAGGGVSSVEELSRPGVNYVVGKGGNLTYQGKSFDPGSTPPGSSHVTVLPNGQFRVNAGPQLTPAQGLALKKAQFEAAKQ